MVPVMAVLARVLPSRGERIGLSMGLAGLRLGFVIGDPALVAELRRMLGPWPVSGPALHIGAAALRDRDWAGATRTRLAAEGEGLVDGRCLVANTPHPDAVACSRATPAGWARSSAGR